MNARDLEELYTVGLVNRVRQLEAALRDEREKHTETLRAATELNQQVIAANDEVGRLRGERDSLYQWCWETRNDLVKYRKRVIAEGSHVWLDASGMIERLDAAVRAACLAEAAAAGPRPGEDATDAVG